MAETSGIVARDTYGMHLTLQLVRVQRASRLDDPGAVGEFLRDLVRRIGMRILAGPLVAREHGPPARAGCSGVVILYESHAAIHTYPGAAAAFLDVFSCREFATEQALRVFARHFGVHEIAEQGLNDRGAHWGTDLASELRHWTERRRAS